MSLHNIRHETPTLNDIIIDRTSLLGNPYKIGFRGLTRKEVIEMYEVYARNLIVTQPKFRAAIINTESRRLFCWCVPLDCHGRIIEMLAKEIRDGKI